VGECKKDEVVNLHSGDVHVANFLMLLFVRKNPTVDSMPLET